VPSFLCARRCTGGIAGVDRKLEAIGARSLETYRIYEAHQVVVWREYFYVCNTGRNCLTIVGKYGAVAEDFYPVQACRDCNMNQLNSVYIDGERLMVGFGNRFRNSFVMRFDFRTRCLQQVDALGLVAHNIIPLPGGVLLCDSLSGCLVYSPWEPDEDGRERNLVRFALRPEEAVVEVKQIGMETVSERHQANASCFPRGLAAYADVVAVGVSELSRRSGRRDTLGRVMLLKGIGGDSLNGSQAAAVIDLGETGAVMDCRFVNCPDLGHPMPDGTAAPRCIV
jgi:hypothetical protein